MMDNNHKIKLEPDGTYTVDFIKRIKGNRYHISKRGYQSFSQAEQAIPILLERRISIEKIERATKKFSLFFEEYLEHRSHKISKSTLLSIRAIYNVLLIDYRNNDVKDVLGIHNIIHLYKSIINRTDTGEKWKNRVIGELRQVVDYACFLKLLSVDESNDDKAILENIPITKKSKERDCYNPHQIKRFLNVIEDENDKDLFTLYIYLGARISEFIGLTWDCYDSKAKVVEIKQQILYLKQGKPVLVNRLKTKESYRKCKLNQECYEILEKRKRIFHAGYLFPKSIDRANDPIPKAALRKKMHYYMKKARLPLISPHGFRHSKATEFMSVCKTMAEVKAAARFLGHSVTMMMETYAHAEEKTIDVLIKRLEDK